MIDSKLLAMLRCPIDGTQLSVAEDSLVDRLNAAIGRGELRDGKDQKITDTIEAGLIAADGRRVYPVRRGIPTLVADEAIEVDRSSRSQV